MDIRDTGYISRMLIEESNRHAGLVAELMEGAASEIDLLQDEKTDLVTANAALSKELERLTVDCECYRIQAVDRGNSYQKVAAANAKMREALEHVESQLYIDDYGDYGLLTTFKADMVRQALKEGE